MRLIALVGIVWSLLLIRIIAPLWLIGVIVPALAGLWWISRIVSGRPLLLVGIVTTALLLRSIVSLLRVVITTLLTLLFQRVVRASTASLHALEHERRSFDVMRQALLCKFETHADIRVILLATGDEEIIENAPHDYYWGCGTDGSGRNMLGHLLMQVRHILRERIKE